MDAPIARRRSVLRREKYPSPFRTSYSSARSIFAEALRLRWAQSQVYAMAAERWSELKLETELAKRRREHALDAVYSFALVLGRLRRKLKALSVDVFAAKRIWEPLSIGDVRVADTPSLVLRRGPPEKQEVGLLSFYVSMTRPLEPRSMDTAAVLLHEFAAANQRKPAEQLAPELCIVVDVFSGQISNASRARPLRLSLATLACEEVAGRMVVRLTDGASAGCRDFTRALGRASLCALRPTSPSGLGPVGRRTMLVSLSKRHCERSSTQEPCAGNRGRRALKNLR